MGDTGGAGTGPSGPASPGPGRWWQLARTDPGQPVEPVNPAGPKPQPGPSGLRRFWSAVVDVWRYDESVASAKAVAALLGLVLAAWSPFVALGVGAWVVLT